jgi:hypothetical protein
MSRQLKRRLSQQDLRALGVTPGLILHKVSPDGHARLEQLTAEASGTAERLSLRRGPNNCSPPEEEGGANR